MKIAILGLGSFGSNMAKTLYDRGHEVLSIDRDKDKIDNAKDFTSQAVHAEASDKKTLEALGVQEMDVVIVSLGHELGSVLTVLYLRELGVKRIIAKALNEDHGKILNLVGATEVVYPEKEMAIHTALRLISPNVLDSLGLISGISIQEIAPAPERFIGRSLRQLDLRNKLGIQVLAVRELVPKLAVFVPQADFVIKASDILIVMGDEKSLKKIHSD